MLDAILFTHDHADQTHGIDDVRALVIRNRRQIPAYMDVETSETLTSKFSYIFRGQGLYPSILEMKPYVQAGKEFEIDGAGGKISVLPIRQMHGSIVSLGFRFGSLAYCNDISAFPDESFEFLSGLDVFIIDALRYAPHPTHANLNQALEWADRIGAKRTILTNLHVDMDYQDLVRTLPEGVEPGYDGQLVELDLIS